MLKLYNFLHLKISKQTFLIFIQQISNHNIKISQKRQQNNMKTNRSNSFRLHRITKTNSLKKTHDSQFISPHDESFKLDALYSVTRGVKHNDVSLITGRDHLNKLRKQPLIQNDLAYDAAHNNMNDMRKKYDQIKKLVLNMQATVFHLKQQKQRYQLKQNTYDSGKNTGNSKVQNLQHELTDKRQVLQTTEWEKKVLLNLRGHHKTDKVFYDQRKFNLQQELSNLKKQLKIFQRQGIQFSQNTDRTGKVYEKFISQLQSEQRQRQQHLNNMYSMIDQKAAIVQTNDLRGIQIQQIAQRAMLDKNLSQKQWQKIFLTHSFLNKMLRNKIQRQMQKFRTVEFAFKQIKTATGVNDAQTLVHKYLNKQQVYGQLLSKISQNQKSIQILRSQTQKLHAEEKTLQSQKQILQNTKVFHQDLHNDLKEFQFYQQKTLMTELLSAKLSNWLERQLKKFQLFDKKQPNQPNRSVSQLFTGFKQKILTSLQKANQIQSSDWKQLTTKPQATDKLFRVQPKKYRKNSIGEQIYDLDQQQTNATNLAEQVDVISIQREQVLRNNEKFMKEVRKRKQEMKKTLIEALDRKDKEKEKPKVAEVKKQE